MHYNFVVISNKNIQNREFLIQPSKFVIHLNFFFQYTKEKWLLSQYKNINYLIKIFISAPINIFF